MRVSLASPVTTEMDFKVSSPTLCLVHIVLCINTQGWAGPSISIRRTYIDLPYQPWQLPALTNMKHALLQFRIITVDKTFVQCESA